MHLNLPKPYADELIYSVFARYFAYLQPTNALAAIKSIDGRLCISTRYVRNAKGLAEKTRSTWGMSALEILNRHTLFPLNGAFLKSDYRLKCTEHFLNSSPTWGVGALGMANSSFVEPKFFKFCFSCLKSDMDNFGETYWRRKHQLSGSLICLEHNELLRSSGALLSPLDRATQDATQFCKRDAPQVASLTDRDGALASAIAERSVKILEGGPTRWLGPNHGDQYKKAAVEIGYGFGVRMLHTIGFGEDLIDYFGRPLLRKLNCQFRQDSPALRNIFYKDGANHPMLHVLVQLFLESRLTASRASLKRNGLDGSFRQAWKCPNSYARHKKGFEIPDVYLRRNKAGDHYFHARCSCGYVFNFRRACDDDEAMPLVQRVSLHGPAVEAEMKVLFKRYGAIDGVCKALNVHHRVVRRVLDGVQSKYQPSPQRIAALRKSWVEEFGRERKGGVYQALMKYDRAWVMKSPSRRRGGQRSSPRTAAAMDRGLAARVEIAAQRLRRLDKRVTVLGIGRLLGKRLNMKNLKSRPRTTAVLNAELDVPSRVLQRALTQMEPSGVIADKT